MCHLILLSYGLLYFPRAAMLSPRGPSVSTSWNLDGPQRLRRTPTCTELFSGTSVEELSLHELLQSLDTSTSQQTHHRAPCEITCAHVWSQSNTGSFRNWKALSHRSLCSKHSPSEPGNTLPRSGQHKNTNRSPRGQLAPFPRVWTIWERGQPPTTVWLVLCHHYIVSCWVLLCLFLQCPPRSLSHLPQPYTKSRVWVSYESRSKNLSLVLSPLGWVPPLCWKREEVKLIKMSKMTKNEL